MGGDVIGTRAGKGLPMHATSSTHHRRLRFSAPFRVGLAMLIASLGLGLGSGMVFAAQSAGATAALTVTNCTSSGPGSLAAVMASATGPSGVTFSARCSSISLTSTIEVAVSIGIEGPGSDALTIIGPQGEAAFDVHPNASLGISSLTIESEYLGIVNDGTLGMQDCAMENDPNQQESEAIDNEGSLNIHDCPMTGNDADLNDDFSVGIKNDGTLSMTQSSMGGFEANNSGGSAIYNEGQVAINKASFIGNVGLGAGAIENDGGSVSIINGGFSNNESINGTGDQIGNDAGTIDIGSSFISNNNEGGGFYNDGTMYLGGMTISSNVATEGGGISNAGTLSVGDSTISGNTSQQGGGGISNAGTLSVVDSTISGNTSQQGGGGIDSSAGSVTIADATMADNSAGFNGGGIVNEGGSMTVVSGTLSGNSAGTSGSDIAADSTTTVAATILANGSMTTDCSGAVTDGGYNLADDASCNLSAPSSINASAAIDAYLGPLSANAFPQIPKSVPLLATSSVTPSPGPDPAVGVIPSSFVLPTGETACSDPDERGVARTAPCDIGAFELAPTAPTGTSLQASSTTVPQNKDVTYTATVSPAPDGGTVAFFDGAGNPATAACSAQTVTAGVATCTVAYSDVRTFNVTATYSGDTDYASSSTVSATQISVVPPPTVTAFSPTSGSSGTTLVIKGANLEGATTVAFNGVKATVTIDTANKIKIIVPAGARTGKIKVVTPNGEVKTATSFMVT
jgi:hypothetical protein